ncbi:MAG: hypothetical protein V4736_16110 [Bdellovibrionota bacterium]
MKNLIFIATIVGLMTGCKTDFRGTIETIKSFTVNTTEDGAQAVPVGTYKSKVSVDSKGVAKVKVYVDGDDDDNAIVFKMNVKKLQNTEFIPAAELGQAADLNARLTKSKTQSEIMEKSVQCQKGPIYQTVCGTNAQGQVICKQVFVGYAYGNQWVRYYEVYEWTDLAGVLYQPGTQNTYARVNGRGLTDRQEYHISTSPCW